MQIRSYADAPAIKEGEMALTFAAGNKVKNAFCNNLLDLSVHA